MELIIFWDAEKSCTVGVSSTFLTSIGLLEIDAMTAEQPIPTAVNFSQFHFCQLCYKFRHWRHDPLFHDNYVGNCLGHEATSHPSNYSRLKNFTNTLAFQHGRPYLSGFLFECCPFEQPDVVSFHRYHDVNKRFFSQEHRLYFQRICQRNSSILHHFQNLPSLNRTLKHRHWGFLLLLKALSIKPSLTGFFPKICVINLSKCNLFLSRPVGRFVLSLNGGASTAR